MKNTPKTSSRNLIAALTGALLHLAGPGSGLGGCHASDQTLVRPVESHPPVQLAQARPPRKGGKGGKRGGGTPDGRPKPRISDTLRANIYADNTFVLYINGKLVAVDSIEFIPHNVITVDILPEYPMTLAVMARVIAHPKTGLEYVDNIGDGGFILKIGERIVTSSAWKAKNFFHGPVGGDAKNPRVIHTPIRSNWFAVDFDDSSWPQAKEFAEEVIGPKEPFYQHDFKGAKWIWSDDLKLDNNVIFRFRVNGPKASFYTER